jgi:2-oxo-4-hydroxy-4-carboxy-5-ureidoimidazoline decarboxylase
MSKEKLPVAAVNALAAADFVAQFGEIAEHSPWVAEQAADARPFISRQHMITAFEAVIRDATQEMQLDLLNAHPDLAGRAAIAGNVGTESLSEQAGAGLDRLTREEFERFTVLNDAYRARNGFPFILAVRGATKTDILNAFEIRIENDKAKEFATALDQVCRIVRFRLEDKVSE